MSMPIKVYWLLDIRPLRGPVSAAALRRMGVRFRRVKLTKGLR